MGNEFGHPEWIDFPREGNGWSHKYARRQWSLVDNPAYNYTLLGQFDKEMIELVGDVRNFQNRPVQEVWHNDGDQILAFSRKDLIFVFNFSPNRSFTDYGLLVPEGSYSIVLNTDAERFGGNALVDETQKHFTQYDKLHARRKKGWLMLYLPARTALVLKKNKE
jgi:1,4-alpha-glucan branching enzyme